MSDLPRLLLCSFDVIPGPSGSSRRLTEYLKALPDRFSVVVLSAKTPDHSHIEKYQGARLLRVPVGSGDLASRIQTFERAVRRQLDSEEYALAHFTDPFGGYVLCEMKGDYGYRLVYEAQTFPSQELRYTHPQTEGDKRFLAKIRRQELFCLMNADLVITGSQTTRTYIQSLGASTEQTRVVRAPVDLGPYTPDVFGVPDSQPLRLMYLGSQAGWQGLPILLRALALAVEQGAQVKLTLVGARHPDWQPHLEDMAKELGLQKHVEFQTPVLHDDLVKVLALADVGVLPLDDVDRNRLQGGPLAKVSEYFAAGRPVLAADLPVTRELLPAAAVLFHKPGDARSLAEGIVALASDVPRRLEMGREARVFAEHELDAGLIRGKLLDIYDELLGKQSAVGTPSELPSPTMTGTPTNRLSQIKPPEGGRRSSRGKGGKKKGQKEELPLVRGQALSDDMLDTRLIKTEPDARPTEPPVVMGLPLRDQKPTADQAESSDPTPVVRPPTRYRRAPQDEPPTSIVTPAQLSEREEPPAPTPIIQMKSLETDSKPSDKGRVPSPPPLARPPPLRPSVSIPAVTTPPPIPVPVPVPIPIPVPVREEEPEEISGEEAQEISDQEELDASATPPHAGPRLEEPEELSQEELQEADGAEAFEAPDDEELEEADASDAVEAPDEEDEVQEVDAAEALDAPDDEPEEVDGAEAIEAPDEAPDEAPNEAPNEAPAPAPAKEEPLPEPPSSALDPWFAQVAHGYCPPEGAQFGRHTPPTNFPGRDEQPPRGKGS